MSRYENELLSITQVASFNGRYHLETVEGLHLDLGDYGSPNWVWTFFEDAGWHFNPGDDLTDKNIQVSVTINKRKSHYVSSTYIPDSIHAADGNWVVNIPCKDIRKGDLMYTQGKPQAMAKAGREGSHPGKPYKMRDLFFAEGGSKRVPSKTRVTIQDRRTLNKEIA